MSDYSPNPRAVATTVAGTRGPENENATRLVAEINDEIYLYSPTDAPLSVFTGRIMGQRTVHNYEFKFLEQDEYPRAFTLSAASLVSDTVLDFNAGEGAKIPTFAVLLNLRTGESVWATSIATDAVTVVRGIGSAQADMVAGDTLVYTRQVFPDGGSKGTYKTVQVSTDFNYTEIIKTGFGFTGRQQNTEFYGGSDVESTRKWAGIEHTKSIEFMMFFGSRQLNTTSQTHYTTFSGGADYFIKNIWNVAGSDPTEEAFVEVLEDAMRWGKGGYRGGRGTKYLFCSSRWLRKLNAWARDRVRITQNEKTLGIKIMGYDSPFGTVNFVHSPILDYHTADRAYLVDLNHVRQVVHRGRGTKLLKNIQENDFDGLEEQYQSDLGAEWSLADSHTRFQGLGL
jgi:hypothetical protein